MRQVIALSFVFIGLLATPAFAAGTNHLTWSRCVLHLNWQHPHQVNKRVCSTYPIRKHHAKVIGTWKRVDRVSPHVEVVLRFPRFDLRLKTKDFRPQTPGLWYSVTAYAPGCGASGAMADGRWPYVGAAAATLPFGTHVSIPGWGSVTVEDRGVGDGAIDLYMNSCSEAFTFGRQELLVTISP